MSYSKNKLKHWEPVMNLVRLAEVSTELQCAIDNKDLGKYEDSLKSFEYWVSPVEDSAELLNMLLEVETLRGDKKRWAAQSLRTELENRMYRQMGVPIDDILDAMNDND